MTDLSKFLQQSATTGIGIKTTALNIPGLPSSKPFFSGTGALNSSIVADDKDPYGYASALSETAGLPTTKPSPSSSSTNLTREQQEQYNAAHPTDSGDVVVTGHRQKSEDQRIRIKPFPKQLETILGANEPDNILSPLYPTNGVLFPYTPSIQFNQDVDWKSIELTHSNYESASYSRTPAVTLTVSGKFTVQTHAEGRYLLAVLHFFRVASKMYFGVNHVDTDMAGVPPPVLLLKGYGPYMFNDLRVIVKNHTYTVDDSVNLVQVSTPGGIVTLPSLLTFSCTLQVVQSPKAQKNKFDLNEFRTGALMRKGGGWI